MVSVSDERGAFICKGALARITQGWMTSIKFNSGWPRLLLIRSLNCSLQTTSTPPLFLLQSRLPFLLQEPAPPNLLLYVLFNMRENLYNTGAETFRIFYSNGHFVGSFHTQYELTLCVNAPINTQQPVAHGNMTVTQHYGRNGSSIAVKYPPYPPRSSSFQPSPFETTRLTFTYLARIEPSATKYQRPRCQNDPETRRRPRAR